MASVVESIFRTYDIRGIVDKALTEETVYWVGKALGSQIVEAGESKVVIGRDGRFSGQRFVNAMTRGLMESGADVIDVGQVMTPMVYFAAATLPEVNSCVVITGSHNPPDYNGIKMVVKGVTLYGDMIQKLMYRIQKEDFRAETRLGSLSHIDISPSYFQRIISDIQLAKPLKVVIDAGNGVASEFAPAIIRALGCEVIELYCQVDGAFPNHHPDPAKLDNLKDLIQKVQETDANIGLAFDGDGDRCGVVDNKGQVLYADRQMMLYARDVLSRQPGAEIIYDIKCTALLPKVIEAAGGKATMWKTGHSYMKAKMRESGAALGGEVSGHMFFKERWYGFDDGVYTAMRMLEIVSKQSLSSADLFKTLPNAYNTPEIDIAFEEGEHYRFMEKVREVADFEGAKIFDLDGIRADFEDGWGLIRPSNTSPVIVLRFEGKTPQALHRIQGLFKAVMRRVDPEISIPF